MIDKGSELDDHDVIVFAMVTAARRHGEGVAAARGVFMQGLRELAKRNDANWARAVWNLKLGRNSDGTVNESEVTDLLALYPDLREASSSGGKLSGDKLIASLWRKAAAKADRARALIAQPRGA